MRNAKGRVDYATWPFFVGQKGQGEFGRFNFFAWLALPVALTCAQKKYCMKNIAQLVCSLAAAAVFLVTCQTVQAGDAPKKILFFSKSNGYQHDMIAYGPNKTSAAEKILAELGKKNNFEFTFTKDGSVFTP